MDSEILSVIFTSWEKIIWMEKGIANASYKKFE